MSKSVRVLIFMEDYTFDLNPADHEALHNKNNMYCIFMNSFFFSSTSFLVKDFETVTLLVLENLYV